MDTAQYTFKKLIAWQKAHSLSILVYQNTKSFPRDELFGLTNQIRRAAVSVSSNIAEGFSRHNNKEKVQFYYMALGSLSEVESQITLALDLKYIDKNNYTEIENISIETRKILLGLIKNTNSR